MKAPALILLIFSLFVSNVLALEKVDSILKVQRSFVLRSTPEFLANSKNKRFFLPESSAVRVAETRRLASGNYAMLVEVLEGNLQGKRLWMYRKGNDLGYQVINGVKTSQVAQEEEVVRSLEEEILVGELTGNSKKEKQNKKSNDKKNENTATSLTDAQREEILVHMAKVREEIASKPDHKKYTANDIAKYSKVYSVPASSKETTSRAGAEDCSKIDNRVEALGENRHQDGVGWCFAYAAADMLTHRLGQRVSALDMSLRYYQQDKINAVTRAKEGGSIVDNSAGSIGLTIAHSALHKNVCSEAVVSSDDFRDALLSKPLNPGENFTDRLNRSQSMSLSAVLADIESIHKSVRSTSIDLNEVCRNIFAAQQLFPNLTTSTILAAAQASKNGMDTLYSLLGLSCAPKDQIAMPKDLEVVEEIIKKPEDKTKLITNLDRALKAGQIVGIAYNVNMLLKQTPVQTGQSGANDAIPTNDGLHASTVVAREFRNGTCQYLIRNTYGSGCGMYQFECERGNIWVPEDVVKASLNSIVYFSK